MKIFLDRVQTLLSKRNQFQLLIIFFGVFFISFIETLGLGSIAGFVAVLSDPLILINRIPHGNIKLFLLNQEFNSLIVIFSIFILSIFLVKNIILVIYSYFEARVERDLVAEISSKLYLNYLKSPYEFHLANNPAALINTITGQVNKTVSGYFFTALMLCREFFLIFLLLFTLLFINWKISLFFFIFLSLVTLFFNKLIKNKLNVLGNKMRILEEKELQNLNQGIGSIKYITIKNNQNFFSNIYLKLQRKRHNINLFHVIIGKLPRLFFEVLAIGLVISITLLFVFQNKPIETILPILAFLTLIVIRIVPAFININNGISSIQFSLPSIEKVVSEFKKINAYNLNKKKDKNNFQNNNISNILFENVSYKFPNSSNNTLNNISFEIKKGEMVGIIGKSGAGKSTLTNLILGLFQPTKGNIKFNSSNINNDNLIGWRKQFGYVPQDIYLIDDTIKKNVAFALNDEEIDEKKVLRILNLSKLSSFVETLPQGIETNLGDRGARLSGGQKQRIGIARALYDDPKVLILDEATSALDNETEEEFIENLSRYNQDKIIIFIAHRLSTLKNCDKFFLFDSGKIIDQGNKKDFLSRQKQFQPFFDKMNNEKK